MSGCEASDIIGMICFTLIVIVVVVAWAWAFIKG